VNLNSKIKTNAIYRHYKGNLYKVHQLARHSETLEWLVFYECLYQNSEGQFWVRPLTLFLEEVNIQGQWISRFALVDELPSE
jgi:hypothetical protein